MTSPRVAASTAFANGTTEPSRMSSPANPRIVSAWSVPTRWSGPGVPSKFAASVVAGRAKFMDALDGGQWHYGDGSFPEVGVTFFAGTFVRHPLALAAARAVLTHLKQSGPQLQQRLAERAGKVAEQLRAILAEFGAPFQLSQFSSLLFVTVPPVIGSHVLPVQYCTSKSRN